MCNYKIERFADSFSDKWDEFVEKKSINGTFLQTRRFLNYHPKGKFVDHSLIFFDKKGNIVAVCPACEVLEDDGKSFYSHKGATYGGIVVSQDIYKVKHILPLIHDLDQYLLKEKFYSVHLKITPDIFSRIPTRLLEYALYYNGYVEYKELNLYIDYHSYKDDILSNFSQGKRSHVKRCIREGMKTRLIQNDEEVEKYYAILSQNLLKYNLNPIHTVDELIEFKNNRLKDECLFVGTYLNEEMVAGGMLFLFEKTRTAHTQYLSGKSEYLKLSPVTFLYFCIIEEMKNRGYEKLSWGICTENLGRYVNIGLINSKEDFGSSYSNNLTYYKSFATKSI